MTDDERKVARTALISGLSVRQLINDLEGKKYSDLVAKHMREVGANLAATVAVHEGLVLPEEIEGTQEILDRVAKEAIQPNFWAIDAGEFLASVSCDLSDALFPTPADEAAVFNLFQLITARLADRARIDADLQRLLVAYPRGASAPIRESGTITKMLGVAIADHDAGRLSRGQLLSIFQDAIDNGDILAESNKIYAVTNVLPLVDAGLLRPSAHLEAFEGRMNQMAADFLGKRRSPQVADSKAARWREFWK